MKKNITKTFLILALFFSGCKAAAAIFSGAFYNDSELALKSFYAAGTLDLELSGESGLKPSVSPGNIASTTLSARNTGTLPLEYGVQAISATGTLCGYLRLDVFLNDVILASGSLGSFSAAGFDLMASSSDSWRFEASLSGIDPALSGSSCRFELVFIAKQGLPEGFEDIEAYVLEVESGVWQGQASHAVINKILNNVDETHGMDPKNEWIELFNPTSGEIDVKNWQICGRSACRKINYSAGLAPGSYLMLMHDASTWKYWNFPEDIAAAYALSGQFGLDNEADIIILKDGLGRIIDLVNWGVPDPGWPNYCDGAWNPGLAAPASGRMLGRVPSGQDTDAQADWRELGLPSVQLISPNGGEVWWVGHQEEIWWTAHNPNGPDSDLQITLYYSNNSGRTWGFIDTTSNTGYYSFRLPLFLDDFSYFVPSDKSRIKVVASGPENFVLRATDISDEDYCPPIDYSLLTQEELFYLGAMGLYQDAGGSRSASPALVELSAELSADEALPADEAGEILSEDPGSAGRDVGKEPDEISAPTEQDFQENPEP